MYYVSQKRHCSHSCAQQAWCLSTSESSPYDGPSLGVFFCLRSLAELLHQALNFRGQGIRVLFRVSFRVDTHHILSSRRTHEGAPQIILLHSRIDAFLKTCSSHVHHHAPSKGASMVDQTKEKPDVSFSFSFSFLICFRVECKDHTKKIQK